MKSLHCLLALIACYAMELPTVFAADRPNILFIYTDDHSHRTISCYPESYSFAKTPNIDQLASDGVRFKYAYIGTWCMPSRASLLTGHYQHGIQSMRMEGKYPGSTYDPEQCPFWPSVFRKNGYQTAHIGKWHTGTDSGHGRDWDHQIVWNRPLHPDNAGNYYYNQLIERDGGESTLVPGYSTDNYTDWAIEYLNGKNRDPDKPWYLWVCYGAVHGPFTPADRHMENYPEVSVPVPADIYPPRAGKPAYMQEVEQWYQGEDGKPRFKGRKRATGGREPVSGVHGSTLDDWVRQYHQGVVALDESVGKLVAALKATGQYDNTLIVFTSDQGIAFGQHGYRIKVAPYDANIRSPLIVSMPSQLPTGKVCDTPIGGVDLVPTFFDFAKIELPWKMHGRSIREDLNDPTQQRERSLLMSFTGQNYGRDTDQIPVDPAVLRKIGQVPWYATIHDGRYKYIRTFVEGETEELYDLDSDREELTNLVNDPKHHARVIRMRQAAIDELRRTDARFADKLPAVASSH
ncbi:MAG: sulfatase-like hydrolase/transferase [Rubripirellula sp.]